MQTITVHLKKHHTDTDYEQENESADDNKMYFNKQDFCQPTGILYKNTKKTTVNAQQMMTKSPLWNAFLTMIQMMTVYLCLHLSQTMHPMLKNFWLPTQPLST